MNRVLVFAAVLVALAYGIREGIDYFTTKEEKRLAEHRARLIVEGMAAGGDVLVGMSMWYAGRRSFDGPFEMTEIMDAAYRRWLAEKGIREVRSFEVVGSQRMSESEIFGQSAWAVGVDADGEEVWMRLVLDEQAEWIDPPP